MRSAGVGTARCRPPYERRRAGGLPIVMLLGGLGATDVLAHDMSLTAHWTNDGVLQGQLTYSDAKPADGNYIRIEARDAPGLSALALQTGADGSFRLPLQPGLAYTISATGDEGHSVTTHLSPLGAEPGPLARPMHPPIYVICAVLFLLSLPLAYRLRRPDADSD